MSDVRKKTNLSFLFNGLSTVHHQAFQQVQFSFRCVVGAEAGTQTYLCVLLSCFGQVLIG